MGFDGARHHRRSIRLAGYDYSQAGVYFITVCTQGRRRLFGRIADGAVQLNEAGRMVWEVWEELGTRLAGVKLDAAVLMPDHLHGVIVLKEAGGEGDGGRMGCGGMRLGDVVHRFKTVSTYRYAVGVRSKGWERFDRRLWQRNYYERIVRDGKDWERVREYIRMNPARWAEGGDEVKGG